MVKCGKRLYVWTENIKVVLCVSQFNKNISRLKEILWIIVIQNKVIYTLYTTLQQLQEGSIIMIQLHELIH